MCQWGWIFFLPFSFAENSSADGGVNGDSKRFAIVSWVRIIQCSTSGYHFATFFSRFHHILICTRTHTHLTAFFFFVTLFLSINIFSDIFSHFSRAQLRQWSTKQSPERIQSDRRKINNFSRWNEHRKTNESPFFSCRWNFFLSLWLANQGGKWEKFRRRYSAKLSFRHFHTAPGDDFTTKRNHWTLCGNCLIKFSVAAKLKICFFEKKLMFLFYSEFYVREPMAFGSFYSPFSGFSFSRSHFPLARSNISRPLLNTFQPFALWMEARGGFLFRSRWFLFQVRGDYVIELLIFHVR